VSLDDEQAQFLAELTDPEDRKTAIDDDWNGYVDRASLDQVMYSGFLAVSVVMRRHVEGPVRAW
jgi:hypothetical protein